MSTMDRHQAAEVLGVRADDDVDVIMAAYRRSTFNTHPDIPGGSAEEFVKVSAAKEVLLSEDADDDGDEGQEQAEDTVSAAAVVAQPIRRVMWLAIARGSAAAVAVVILVIILAPTAPTTGPIVIVAAGYAVVKTWRASGSPRPWPLLLNLVRRDGDQAPAKASAPKPRGAGWKTGRSLADEDFSRPPRDWG